MLPGLFLSITIVGTVVWLTIKLTLASDYFNQIYRLYQKAFKFLFLIIGASVTPQFPIKDLV